MEDSVAIPQNLEPETPFDPAIPLLGIYPEDYKTFYYKDTCTCMFIAALFTIAKTWNQPKCSCKYRKLKEHMGNLSQKDDHLSTWSSGFLKSRGSEES